LQTWATFDSYRQRHHALPRRAEPAPTCAASGADDAYRIDILKGGDMADPHQPAQPIHPTARPLNDPYHDGWWYLTQRGTSPLDDATIRSIVTERLSTDRRIQSGWIDVHVMDRVVVLDGWVDSWTVRSAASGHAWETPGVVDVCNRLRPRRA
jgi:hypothetical protein